MKNNTSRIIIETMVKSHQRYSGITEAQHAEFG